MITLQVQDPEAQLIILALVELALNRPGWMNYCEEVSGKFGFGSKELFQKYIEMRGEQAAQVLTGYPEIIPDPGYPVQ